MPLRAVGASTQASVTTSATAVVPESSIRFTPRRADSHHIASVKEERRAVSWLIQIGNGWPSALSSSKSVYCRWAWAFTSPGVSTPAQRRSRFLFYRSRVEGRVLDRHRASVDSLTQELMVEGSRTLGTINAPEVGGQRRIAANGDPVSAFLPQQKLQQPLDMPVVHRDIRALVAQHFRAVNRYRTVAPLQRDRQLRPTAIGLDGGPIGSGPERGRDELRV